MYVIGHDKKEGAVKLRVQIIDDLWHLFNVIEEGDLVFAKTYRREAERPEITRPTRPKKKPVYLGVRIENIEFQKFSDRLRLTGVIEYGERDVGNYHTIELEPGKISTLVKEEGWKKYQLERLSEAQRITRQPQLLVVTLEDATANFGIIHQYGVEMLGEIDVKLPSKKGDLKERENRKKSFFGRVAQEIDRILRERKIPHVILAGPGFTKNELYTFLKGKNPKLAKNATLEDISTGGGSGINEVIRRGAVERVIQESRLTRDTRLTEQVLQEIGKGTGKVAYGRDEVGKAAAYGAIDKLLITDSTFRDAMVKDRELEEVIEEVDGKGGEIIVISTEHEAGKKLRSLGGLAALLRYSLK